MSNAEKRSDTPPIGDDKPMNYAQAAAWLGWKEYTLRQHTNAGLVPHKRIGRNVMFMPSVLRRWLTDDMVMPTPPAPVAPVNRKRRSFQ